MNSRFENIFEKKNKKEEIKEKIKIEIDYREKNSLVPARLIKNGFEVEFKELKVGDYIVKEVVIERKTISDFLSSMINKRLLKQIEELQQYEKKLIVVEGFEEKWLYYDSIQKGISSNAIRGFLLSILLKHNIPVIFTKNPDDTARFIETIANKKETNISLKAKKRFSSIEEQMQFIIESFPGIGPKTAKKLLQEFKTIKNISNAKEEELQKILGKKSESFSNLLNKEYS